MLVSHGRGGAGNYAARTKFDKVTPIDLKTPVLTSPMVTTGRGGSGNMLKNDDAAQTRLRQDVEPAPRRSSSNVTYFGRGGAANIFRPGSDEAAAAKASFDSSAVVDDSDSARSSTSIAARGKAWFHSLGKKA
ncbi:hypothetical protein SODALDRAFT_281424 [Sodiomyces alkalinus F11]|uniref:Uncharacterized protein n=1 Tax=Sodiomyces alkalinus (strain CBS 110278 / VKM F-3762 / F11) TaxID=1314773 RepID=A0A3N2PQZ5_SODAK|nr:hypothetical protein SODALDRAFT_281424 [Sodiomyces alkalinus F11]ROT36905.1 hypothetical protein SODALDRAFT_281424 [Sodiomyces alkalinus F11]